MVHFWRRAVVVAVSLTIPPASALAAASAAPRAPLVPIRAAAPPVIDGDLSDAVWQQAPSVTGFKTWFPDFGKDMPDQTVAYYAYDAENLYFAFRAFDSEPGRIKASVTERDTIVAEDWICINLDSFGDQQALYGLYVNPLGIQADSRYAAGKEDYGVDIVWYSAGRIDDKGYTIEVRIPFKSLRYGGSNPVRMRLIFERRITRRSEQGTWPELDPKIGPNFLVQNTPIEFANIRHYTLLEVLPDATYSRHLTRPGETLEQTSGGGDLGVTAKYGVTAQLTLDGAVNPDFSQVEADAGQIDINRRYALFFPEKRPFFLEGRELFNLVGADYSPLQYIVHTRTIENPAGGAKLTGKVSRADNISAIYAVDELADDAVAPGGLSHAQVAVARYKRSLNEDSYAGGFYTGREVGDAFNRVFGGDASIRVTKSGSIGMFAFGSTTRQDGAAESTNGHAVLGNYSADSRNLALYLGAQEISRGFETWTGYLTRAGLFQGTAVVTPHLYPKIRNVRRVDPTLTTDHLRDEASGLWEHYNDASVTVRLPRNGNLSAGYHWSNEVFNGESFPTSGVRVAAGAQLTTQVTVSGSVTHGDAIYYAADPFGGTASGASLLLRYQPAEQWQFEGRATYAGFSRARDGRRLYDYAIYRGKASFQVNRYLFFRAIAEYNTYRRQLLTDFLASFTYIPGTVLHAGYGSFYEKVRWEDERYVPGTSFLETRRGFFFKASYLWRL
jgi:hypothetical protein